MTRAHQMFFGGLYAFWKHHPNFRITVGPNNNQQAFSYPYEPDINLLACEFVSKHISCGQIFHGGYYLCLLQLKEISSHHFSKADL